jgi:hypothetical protein
MTLSLAFLTPDFLVEQRGFEPVTLGTAGIRANLTVCCFRRRMAFAELRQYRRRHYRRTLGRVVDRGHRGVGPGG